MMFRSLRLIGTVATRRTARIGAVGLAVALASSSPARAFDRWFEPGCFHQVAAADEASALSEADKACRAASETTYGEAPPPRDALLAACAGAEDMWVRSELAMALITLDAWEDASRVLEEAVTAKAAPILVNMLHSVHDGDWIAVRAQANPSAACMAGVRLEEALRDVGNERAAITSVLRRRAIERYRLAAEDGLAFARERLKALSADADQN